VQKSTIIATCLLNAATVVDMETGEALVLTTFQQHFPDESFENWNGDVDPAKAAHIVSERAGEVIDVAQFIADLQEPLLIFGECDPAAGAIRAHRANR